jgi:hypothetical protein
MNPQTKSKYTKDWHDIALRRKTEENYICFYCKIKPKIVTGQEIQVHHADGNKFNNHKSNLIVCCDRCHTIAEKKRLQKQKTQ